MSTVLEIFFGDMVAFERRYNSDVNSIIHLNAPFLPKLAEEVNFFDAQYCGLKSYGPERAYRAMDGLEKAEKALASRLDRLVDQFRPDTYGQWTANFDVSLGSELQISLTRAEVERAEQALASIKACDHCFSTALDRIVAPLCVEFHKLRLDQIEKSWKEHEAKFKQREGIKS